MFNHSSRNSAQLGQLYIVATPIGNRDDITLRAIQILNSVGKILAEDTRHSKLFLSNLGIQTPLSSFHLHNESEKTPSVLQSLLQGESFALISDAGTPLISDPGYPLVSQARQLGIPVIPIPGPCAIIAALSASGIPCDTFTFIGFLPAKKSARCKKLESLQSIAHTIVFYESTHRIKDCIEDIATIFGEACPIVLAKELTKTFEQIIQGTSKTLIDWLTEDEAHVKGEFVLILPPRSMPDSQNAKQLLTLLLEELPVKQAVKIAAKISGENKNELYALALQLNS